MTQDPPLAGIARCEIPTPSGAVYRPGSVVHRDNAPGWFDWLLVYNFIVPADMYGKPLPPATATRTDAPEQPPAPAPSPSATPTPAPLPKRRTRRKTPPPDAAA